MSAKARIEYLLKRVRLLRSVNVSRTRCCSLKQIYTKQKRETWPVLLWYRDCLYLYHISHICRTCQLTMYYIWFWSTCRYLAPLQSILLHVTVLNMMISFYMIWFYLFSLWMNSYGVTIQMKATKQFFSVVLFIIPYKVVLTILYVKKILWCENSNETSPLVFSEERS